MVTKGHHHARPVNTTRRTTTVKHVPISQSINTRVSNQYSTRPRRIMVLRQIHTTFRRRSQHVILNNSYNRLPNSIVT